MTLNLYVKFNNYYNRIIKKYSSLSDYASHSTAVYPYVADFNPNDGVTAEAIVNHWVEGLNGAISYIEDVPDYLVVSDEQSNIVSRWYIVEAQRLRGGQYKLGLRRDVIADNYDALLNSKLFIEKGVITDPGSKLIYNSENYGCNQIKKSEILLKDETNCPWLVLYVKKDSLSGTINVDYEAGPEVYETLLTPIAQWEYYDYVQNQKPFESADTFLYRTSYHAYKYQGLSLYADVRVNSSTGETQWTKYGVNNAAQLSYEGLEYEQRSMAASLGLAYRSYTLSSLNTTVRNSYNLHTLDEGNELYKYANKIIKDSQGKFFQVKIISTTSSKNLSVNAGSQSSLSNAMRQLWNTTTGQSQTPGNRSFEIMVPNHVSYTITLEPREDLECTADLSDFTGRTKSSLFDVLTMPYGDFVYKTASGSLESTVIANKDISKNVMDAIAKQLGGSSKILDYQIVPYCPVQQWISLYIPYPTLVAPDGYYIDFVANTFTKARVWLVPEVTSTFNVYVNELEEPLLHIDSQNVKIMKYENDCRMLRLCSPNYNGIFEFNLAKNGGNVNFFNVDMTLKPQTPYIHVNPDFANMYGRDYNDVRGLVCGGDFSLGIVDDAWEQYQIQNKNFQNIFDRQIQSMDFESAIARQENAFATVSGAVSGAATGAAGGALAGGGYGAAIGGGIGLLTGIAGGVLDTINLEKRQAEARSFSIDNFNMQLGNIKALPYSITRTDALTGNNKLFPFLEVYECSEEERTAYMNKLEYDGMTIGVIDELNKWVGGDTPQYVKAKMIRCEDVSDDFHLLNEIGVELNKGVYI